MMLQALLYALVVAGAAAVVFTPDPKRAAFVLSGYGMALALLFLALQAPDVALSEIAVGSTIVPLIIMVALAKMERR